MRIHLEMKTAVLGQTYITATGCKNIITAEHFLEMKDGALLANARHFDVEIDAKALRENAIAKRIARQNVEEFTMTNKSRLYLLAERRLVNLVAADGHPAEVMDMSFANQMLAAEHLVRKKGKLEAKVYRMPLEIDKEIAHLWLVGHGMTIDALTDEQTRYLHSWQ